MATPGRPQFFCTRPDGTLTPLVAVDEMPAGTTIRGVSRKLHVSETQGMTSCGLATPRPEPWAIDGVTHPSAPGVINDLVPHVQNLLYLVMTNGNVPEQLRVSARQMLFEGVDRAGIAASEGPATGRGVSSLAPTFYRNTQSVGRSTPTTKKEYCSYWIRHGECDYAQQGCLYKHEMPLDPIMLDKLGLRDIPRWYREKYSLPSLLDYVPVREQLTIPDRPTMQALPSPESTTHGGNNNSNKSSTSHGNGRFARSPPRGPANRGVNGGFNNNHYRGAHRNGAGGNWKNNGRNGRNRAMSVTRQSVCSEQSSKHSLPTEGTPSSGDFGLNGWDPVVTPPTKSTSPAHITAQVPAAVAPVAFTVPSVPANKSLLDDGNSRNRALGWKHNGLTQRDKDVFEPVSKASNEPPSRRTPSRRMYAHSSEPSSEGGVMLPKNFNLGYIPNTKSFAYADVAAGKVPCPSNSSNAAKSTRGSSTTYFGDLTMADNVPLTSVDTQVTWGPIGGPILKRTTPPADGNVGSLGSCSTRPHTN